MSAAWVMRAGLATYLAAVALILLGPHPGPLPDPLACSPSIGAGEIRFSRETAEHLAVAWNDPTLTTEQVAARFRCASVDTLLQRRGPIERHGFVLRAR